MTRAATPKLGGYAGLAALGLLAALALGRPELVVLAAPFAAIVAAGLALATEPQPSVALRLDRSRAIEGDEIAAELELHAPAAIEQLEVLLDVPEGLAVEDGPNPVVVRLRHDEPRTLALTLRCERWGGYTAADVVLRARDRFGLFVYQATVELEILLKVYPRAEALKALVRPLRTQVFAGNQVAREKGEGIEFADLRPYAPGDVVRRVNWRASARRDGLWVNEHHPERNAEVIVFLDSFVEVRRGDRSSLDATLRAAASLVAAYVGRRDRVGVVGFGGVLRWLQPGTGIAQLYRIVDALVDTEITLSYAWKDIDIVPRRMLPPQALVVALTPLLDDRTVAALLELRGRGFDVVVVEISPLPFAPPVEGELGDVAHRLWKLRREALRARYERTGVAVVEWTEDLPLEAALREANQFRRHARLARA